MPNKYYILLYVIRSCLIYLYSGRGYFRRGIIIGILMYGVFVIYCYFKNGKCSIPRFCARQFCIGSLHTIRFFEMNVMVLTKDCGKYNSLT